MPELEIINTKGEKAGKVELPDLLLQSPGSPAAVHEVVRAHQANRRRGTASTKTRAEVAASGRKPWRQKGTGRARSGDRANPLWRGGGVIFGPKPRDFSFTVPKKVRRKALKSILVTRFQEGRVVVLDDLVLEEPKTKVLAGILSAIDAGDSALILTMLRDKNLRLAAANLPGVEVVEVKDLSTYHVVSHQKLLITKDALEHLQAWMEKIS